MYVFKCVPVSALHSLSHTLSVLSHFCVCVCVCVCVCMLCAVLCVRCVCDSLCVCGCVCPCMSAIADFLYPSSFMQSTAGRRMPICPIESFRPGNCSTSSGT